MKKAEEHETEPLPAEAPPAEAAPSPAPPAVDPLAELQQKVAAAEDKYLRLLAEFDNFKRRTLRERDQMIESAAEQVMQDLIVVRENFERALAAAGAGDAASLADGMRLIYASFDQVLQRHGLAAFGQVGEAFDPLLHDAMMNAPSAEVPANHLGQVVERGYRLRGRVVKHARVIVSSGAPQAGVAAEEANENQAAAD